MKKRYLYAILFGIPGFIVSAILAFVFFGLTVGVLWIYGFGDNSWPASIEKILPISFALVFLIVWAATIALGFVVGKRLERDPILNKGHIQFSISVIVLAMLFIIFYQLRAGNIGPKSDGQVCSEYCTQKGYSASSMPPRNSGERICSCLDDSGSEILRIPLDSILPNK